MICGLPGSGKSTLAAELEKEGNAFRFEPDSWLLRIVQNGNDERARAAVESIQWEIAQKALALGADVILEFGFWSKAERLEFRSGAEKLGAKVQLHYLSVPLEELKKRISSRNQSLPAGGLFVDPDQIEIWAQSFEPPTAEEFI
jgi:predicted kinase